MNIVYPQSLYSRSRVTIEEFYQKEDEVVYWYWRLLGSASWNRQMTPLKEMPFSEYEKNTSNDEEDD